MKTAFDILPEMVGIVPTNNNRGNIMRYKYSDKQIKLTKYEAEQVEWALGAMGEYWTTPDGAYERDGALYDESDLPYLTTLDGARFLNDPRHCGAQKYYLILSNVEEINDDLEYRISEQLAEISHDCEDRMETMRVLAAINRIKRKCGWNETYVWQ